jgi:hypothetical protein
MGRWGTLIQRPIKGELLGHLLTFLLMPT